jgi:Cu/Ag efflux pump CusA
VLTQNSASIGAYLRTDNVGNYCDIGSSNALYARGLYLFYNVVTNKDFSRNNNDVGAGGTTTASSGFIINKRTTSTDMKTIRNNSLNLSNGNPTTGLNASAIFISAMGNTGVAELFSNRQTAFNFISEGLNDTEASNLYTRVQAYQTALNRQIP